MPVDQKELEICRRRGHEFRALSGPLWSRCKWCGIWVRTVTTTEEREDDPPDKERDPFYALVERVDRREGRS
jgi:hypothetical protein